MESEEACASHLEEDIISKQRDWGPIVNYKPVLTSDSKYLLVSSGSTVKVLSTATGSLIKELLFQDKVIGVLPTEEEEVFVTCDENAAVCFWQLNKECQEIKYVIRLQESYRKKVVTFQYDRQSRDLFLLVKLSESDVGILLTCRHPYTAPPVWIAKDVQLGANKIAVSSWGNHVAYLPTGALVIVQTRHSSSDQFRYVKHLAGERNLTCVAFHPSEEVVATGDNTGRVVLWYQVTDNIPKKMILHWHTLPLADLVFSSSGNELMSGGGECVLVKWQLVKEERYFLPRVGMDIKFITTDTENNFITLSHVDNSITIVNSKSNDVERVIHGFALNTESPNPFMAGIQYDPRTRAMVTNGRTGHVQFYDMHHNKQLCQLDITLRNYYTQERNLSIHNNDVQHIAMSPSGHQMATVEYQHDRKTSLDIRLKFWKFNLEEQEWHLNTCFDMPHEKALTGLCFQPTQEMFQVCVSSSEEGKFKIWEESNDSDTDDSKTSWSCRGAGFYRNLPVTAITFSPDASLLAAAFNNILTFWEPSSVSVKGTLSQPYLTENILQVEFGRGEGCRSLVVTRSEEWLCVWDLLTCSLVWRVSIRSTCMAADPLSPYMAIFSKDCKLFIFDPRRSTVLSVQRKICTAPPLSAAFIPRIQKTGPTSFWNAYSAFFYISHDQTLHTVEVGGDLNTATERIAGQVRQLVQEVDGPPPAATPFATLLATVRTAHATQPYPTPKGSAEFGVQLEKSTEFIQKVLNDTRVYRLESFAQLASEFCKLVIPEPETSQDKEEQQEFVIKVQEREDSTSKKTSTFNKKKKKKKDFQRVAETDFSSLKL